MTYHVSNPLTIPKGVSITIWSHRIWFKCKINKVNTIFKPLSISCFGFCSKHTAREADLILTLNEQGKKKAPRSMEKEVCVSAILLLQRAKNSCIAQLQVFLAFVHVNFARESRPQKILHHHEPCKVHEIVLITPFESLSCAAVLVMK